jgi:hypothetical protein
MVKRFNEFIKESIDINDIKSIARGTKVLYKGSPYTVGNNNGSTISLIDDEDETLDVNYSMFSASGMVKY